MKTNDNDSFAVPVGLWIMNKLFTPTDSAEMDAVLAKLVGDRGRFAWQPIDDGLITKLTTAESLAVARSVPKRRAEFATGRALLRRLLDSDAEILRTATGAPDLPGDMVGSLTHDDGIALAVVAPSQSMRAVGVDVEIAHELPDGVVDIVVRHDDITPDPISAFVAKEAAYKAWSVLGGEMLEHHDVQIVIDGDSYRAELRGELSVDGRLGRAAGRVVACVFIPTR